MKIEAMKIVVVGAGAWGTALAVSAAKATAGHSVCLLARDSVQALAMQTQRENTRYLPGIALPPALRVLAVKDPQNSGNLAGLPGSQVSSASAESQVSAEYAALLAQADLLVIATPLSGLKPWLLALQNSPAPVVWLCKGMTAISDSEPQSLLAGELLAKYAPNLIAGVLSGPSFAQEVANGRPTALVVASPHARVQTAAVAAFHTPSLRIYASDDRVGVEVGGAVKNVLAIATGLCDGLGLGLNARAALVTRGLAEMTRFGVRLGAKAETFMGLSGLGDLVLTATGDLSRNRQVGLLLAQGQSLQAATASLGHVAEGVLCARAVVQRAQSLGVDMPIAQCVVALLDGKINAPQAVALLMGREPAVEA